MKKEALRKTAVTAVFTAIAFLLTFVFKFKVSFLTFDFKDAVISVVSLAFGPAYGVLSALTVALLEFLSISDTGIYGLIMNFISSGTFALICGIIYRYKRTFSGAIIAAISSAVGVTAVMMVANYFITPYYMGVSRSDVVALIPTLLLPFNLAKTIVNASATLVIYKPVTSLLKRSGIIKGQKEYRLSVRSVVLAAVAAAVIILTVVYLVFSLNAEFRWLA